MGFPTRSDHRKSGLSRFPKSGSILPTNLHRREIGDIRSDHVSSRAGDMGKIGIRGHLEYAFKLCPPRASVLIFEGSKARREFCAEAGMNKT